jgi:hypothetical protein
MTGEEKNTLKKYIITGVVGFIPELFFSWIVGRIIDTSLWYVWLGLQVIKLFLWILRSVVGYLLFHLLWKHSTIDDIYASLVQHKYPNPKKYFTAVSSDYLVDVMWDDEIEMKTRLDAAQAYGTVTGLANTQGLFGAIRMEKILMRAIEKYHKINFSGRDYQANPDEG